MIENSAQGLAMVDGEATVNVTREEEHQAILARYPVAMAGQRQVAVELGWCTIASGKYRGQPAIEVRLDGHRVGELTFLMSQRYTPMVGDIVARQGRPGCVAVIRRGTNGLEMVLRLPRVDAAAPIPLPAPVAAPAPAATPAAAASTFARHKIAWIAAGVVAVLLLIGTIANGGNDSPSTTNVVDLGATPTTTPAPTTTTTLPTTTTTPPAAVAAPAATPAAPQAPATQAPVPQPKTTTKKTTAAPPPAAPQPACDPNYTGCVPIATDVDCAGGSGNGPAYVQGPVQVIGRDIYGLDADHDGIGCERD